MQQVAFSRKNDNNEKKEELNEQFEGKRLNEADRDVTHIFKSKSQENKTFQLIWERNYAKEGWSTHQIKNKSKLNQGQIFRQTKQSHLV